MGKSGLVYLGKTGNGRTQSVGRLGMRLDMSVPQAFDKPPMGGYFVVELSDDDDQAVLAVWPDRSTFVLVDPATQTATAPRPIAQRAIWAGVVIGGGRKVVVAGKSWDVTDAVIVYPPQALTADEAKRAVVQDRGELWCSNLMILAMGGKGRALDADGRVVAPITSPSSAKAPATVEVAIDPVPAVALVPPSVESEGGLRLAMENPDGTFSQSTLYSELHPGRPASTAQHAAVRGDDGHLYGLQVSERQVTIYDLTESEQRGHLETTGTYPVIDGSAPIPSLKQAIFPGGPRATVVHVRDGATYPDRMSAERAGFPATGDSPLQQAVRAQQSVVNRAGAQQVSASVTPGDRVARTILFVSGHAQDSVACAGDAVRLHRMMADPEVAHQISLTVAARHHKLLITVQSGTSDIVERQIRSLTKAMRATGIGVSMRLDAPASSVSVETANS